MPTNVLESIVEVDSNVEAFGEDGCGIHLLFSQGLGEVKVISLNRILTLIWIFHLCHMWECSSKCSKVDDFPWGVPILAKSSLIWISCTIPLLFYDTTTSWIGKPSYICDTISIISIFFCFTCFIVYLCRSWSRAYPLHSSSYWRFELGVSCISLLWFLCEVVDGIISAKLMVSNLIVDMAVDLPSHLCLSLWCLSCNSFQFFFCYLVFSSA